MTRVDTSESGVGAREPEPACHQRLITGLIGGGVVAFGAVLLTLYRVLFHPTVPTRGGYIILLILAFCVMALLEMSVGRVHRFQFDFSRRRCRMAEAHGDVLRRMGALLASLMLAWVLYWVFGEYGLRFTSFLNPSFEKSWYAPFFRFFIVLTCLLPILALPYFYLCAVFGKWPREEDEFIKLWEGYGSCIHLKKAGPQFTASLRSLCVKFYFVPLMTVFFLNNGEALEFKLLHLFAGPWAWDSAFFRRSYEVMYEALYFVDVNIALLGYICCFRVLDTQVRSADATLSGWLITLLCYPPFNTNITGRYLPYNEGGATWGNVLAGFPWSYCIVGVTILILTGIYLYATLAFGLRFSNLTHRGIICKGPYRWVRHPAYVAKNLSWWLVSLPFLNSPTACARLLLFNVIYILRALTEERHLSHDPVYREYMKTVKWRFIPGIV